MTKQEYLDALYEDFARMVDEHKAAHEEERRLRGQRDATAEAMKAIRLLIRRRGGECYLPWEYNPGPSPVPGDPPPPQE